MEVARWTIDVWAGMGGAVDVEQGLSGTMVGCRSEGECHDEDVEVWGGVKRAISKRF